jgi:hypothetical protein
MAFVMCNQLKSVCIPSSVEFLAEFCFGDCNALESVTFENGSKLSVIGEAAFAHTSLRSLCVPASVEGIGDACFRTCWELRSLAFEAPSALRRLLSIPSMCCCEIEVPDSVEVLDSEIFVTQDSDFVISFGARSSLQRIALYESACMLCRTPRPPRRAFVRLCEVTLRAFRSDLSYDGSELSYGVWTI